MRIEERDISILKEVYRFRFCLGRHIKVLCDFTGSRACDRRLKALVDVGYLGRKKLLYGVPSLYYLSKEGKKYLGGSLYQDKDNLNRIPHHIAVLDTLCYFKTKYNLTVADIQSEKELHALDGFGVRKHKPDFTFLYEGEYIAVEVELTLKAKNRFEENVKDNYLNYYKQIWVVPRTESKIVSLLRSWQSSYDNIEVMILEDLVDKEEVK